MRTGLSGLLWHPDYRLIDESVPWRRGLSGLLGEQDYHDIRIIDLNDERWLWWQYYQDD